MEQRVRQRFKRNAICSTDGTNESYQKSKKAHNNYISENRKERVDFIDNVNYESKEINCAEDLIGKYALIFHKRIIITKYDAQMYWNAYGKNITLA